MNAAQSLKKPLRYLPWVVYAAAGLAIGATVTRVSGHALSTRQLGEAVEQCAARNKTDEEKSKELLSETKAAGDRLKKKNAFVPPPPKPNPPVCLGIIGDRALFGDNLHKAGDKVGAAEIISVGTTKVVIKWEDREMTLVPFEVSGGGSTRGSSPDPRASGTPRPEGASGQPAGPQGGASTTQVRGSGPGGPPAGPTGVQGGPRGEFMNMSTEERQQMVDRFRNMSTEERDRFREEQRQRFGERGGPAPGGGGQPRGGRGR